jgi:hypothetical protein
MLYFSLESGITVFSENIFAYVQNSGLDYVKFRRIVWIRNHFLELVQNKPRNSETTRQSEFGLEHHSSGLHSVIPR